MDCNQEVKKDDYMKYQLMIEFLHGIMLVPAGSWAGAADISGTWEFSVSLDGARKTSR